MDVGAFLAWGLGCPPLTLPECRCSQGPAWPARCLRSTPVGRTQLHRRSAGWSTAGRLASGHPGAAGGLGEAARSGGAGLLSQPHLGPREKPWARRQARPRFFISPQLVRLYTRTCVHLNVSAGVRALGCACVRQCTLICASVCTCLCVSVCSSACVHARVSACDHSAPLVALHLSDHLPPAGVWSDPRLRRSQCPRIQVSQALCACAFWRGGWRRKWWEWPLASFAQQPSLEVPLACGSPGPDILGTDGCTAADPCALGLSLCLLTHTQTYSFSREPAL